PLFQRQIVLRCKSANDAKRAESDRVDSGSDRQSTVALVTRDRRASKRTHSAVNSVGVITELLQLRLDTGDNLFGREPIIAVNRLVAVVVRIGIVTPRGIPPAVIPAPPAKVEKDDRGAMVPPPPVVVMMITLIQVVEMRLVGAGNIAAPIPDTGRRLRIESV